ncbi:MAG TPA: peptidoglycan bridge formation glycyltransferase FemA/FemB family protein [Pseudonocardia sp.]
MFTSTIRTPNASFPVSRPTAGECGRETAGRALSVTVTDRPQPADVAAWSLLVARAEGGDVAQLPGWATLRAGAGFTARYVLVHAGTELLGGAQLLERRLPLLGRVGYLPYGPVLASRLGTLPALHAAVSDALCGALDTLARGHLRALFVQPPTGGDSVTQGLLERGFRPSDAGAAPGASLRLDLRKDVAELRSGLSKRLRTWTNRWAARGVTVRQGTDADLPLLADLIGRSGEHQGFSGASEPYLRTMLAELADPEVGQAVFFVGEQDGEPVAASLFTRCAGTLTLRFAGMDRERANRCNVPAAVHWHAIGYAREAGLRWYDFGGISSETAHALAAGGGRDEVRGVDRFKAGFGGELHHYPAAVELLPGPLLRAGYDLSRRTSMGRNAVEWAKRALRTGRLRRS